VTVSRAIQDHYPPSFAHCYGCGPANSRGLHLKSAWSNGEIVATFTPEAHDMAMPGFVYGGLIASLIDCHAMATAAAHVERAEGRAVGEQPALRYVTASLHVQYLKPTPLGEELLLRARVTETGRRKVVVAVSVETGGSVTAKGEVVAVPIPESMSRARNDATQ